MKSPFALPAGLAMLLTLSACGQTGPLYMPHTPPKTARHHGSATTPAAKPAPAATAIGTSTSPPAPAAGVVGPSVESNANDTQATQSPTPATQQ